MKKTALIIACVTSLLAFNAQAGALAIIGAGPASSSALDGAVGYSVDGELAWSWTDDIDRSSIGLSFGYVGGLDGAGAMWGDENATGSMSAFTVAPRVGMVFPVTERVGFYLQGQFGVSRIDAKASGLYDDVTRWGSASGSDWGFSWGFGAGLDFNIAKRQTLRVGYSLLSLGNFNTGSGHEFAPGYLHGLIIAYSIQF
jgi:opacity protein-like surface antigen